MSAPIHSAAAQPGVAARALDFRDIRVSACDVIVRPRVVVRGVDAVPGGIAIRGARFFEQATEPGQIDQASLFEGALVDGRLDGVPTDAIEPETSDGRDPLRSLYFLLFPPLRDVLQKGFDLPFPLHAYQADGVSFLARRKHALLADDMGLGKTIQTIVAIRALLGSGFVHRALVICPAGLKSNWKSEFRRWAPEIRVRVIQGDASQRNAQWNGTAHVAIANYELMRNDSELLPKRPFDLVVLDEAQRIKNTETNTSRAVRAIPRRASWCLTGTPIENSGHDLAAIAAFMKPDLILPDSAAPEAVRQTLAPYFLRRRKGEVLRDLPPKQQHTVRLDLTDAQRDAYQSAEEEGTVYLRSLGETVTLQHVLALITKLKQICNFDPETSESAKLDYLADSLDVIVESGEKALIFSQYTQTLEYLAGKLDGCSPLLYHGGLSRVQKDETIRRFKEEESIRLLLVSLRSGGVGLNLQEASYVYHFDRWWNPAVERQAEDRAYRMGQTRPVLVSRLVMNDTVEERIDQVLTEKQALFDQVIDEAQSDSAPRALSDAEYFHLVGLDPALAKARRQS
ncbi:DEAD/DEAH box helicase [Candidatus Poribacteria bacterium]|nr:DEAD/DEAH box helicase [Candidatus Poribacteria bacterium]